MVWSQLRNLRDFDLRERQSRAWNMNELGGLKGVDEGRELRVSQHQAGILRVEDEVWSFVMVLERAMWALWKFAVCR